MFYAEHSEIIKQRHTYVKEIWNGQRKKRVDDHTSLKELIKEVNGDDYLIFNNCFTDKWIWNNHTVRNSWSSLDKEYKPCPFDSQYEADYHDWHDQHVESG